MGISWDDGNMLGMGFSENITSYILGINHGLWLVIWLMEMYSGRYHGVYLAESGINGIIIHETEGFHKWGYP